MLLKSIRNSLLMDTILVLYTMSISIIEEFNDVINVTEIDAGWKNFPMDKVIK